MWAPALETSSALVLLAAAFGGSLHCAAMCGPIRLLAPEGRWPYQAGRALAYLGLGALAGFFGWSIPPWALVALLALAVLATLLRLKAPALWRGRAARLLEAASRRPLTLGLASALLPCGLLHAWILAAAATASPLRGAAVLGALWLGTLPALELGSSLLARPLAWARRHYPRAVAVSLLLLASVPAAWRAHAAFSAAPAASCHHGHETK